MIEKFCVGACDYLPRRFRYTRKIARFNGFSNRTLWFSFEAYTRSATTRSCCTVPDGFFPSKNRWTLPVGKTPRLLCTTVMFLRTTKGFTRNRSTFIYSTYDATYRLCTFLMYVRVHNALNFFTTRNRFPWSLGAYNITVPMFFTSLRPSFRHVFRPEPTTSMHPIPTLIPTNAQGYDFPMCTVDRFRYARIRQIVCSNVD